MSRPEFEKKVFSLGEVPDSDQSAGPQFPIRDRESAIEDFDRETAQFALDRTVQIPVSGDVSKLLVSAATLADAGDVNPARDLYEAVLRRDHQNEEALCGMAKLLIAAGLTAEARAYLAKLSGYHPSFANIVWYADELYLADQFEQARDKYLEAQLQPHFEGDVLFSVFKNLGNIGMQLGDLDSAEEYYNKAFTLNPDSDALLVNFGSLAIHHGELDVAVRRFRQAVEINSRSEKAWIGLGMIHREFGDVDLAWANIEKALDIDPANSTAIRLVCDWAIKDNEVEKAVALCGAFLVENDEDDLIHMMQAKFYFILSRPQKAIVEINRALEINPQIEDGQSLKDVIEEEIDSREAMFK